MHVSTLSQSLALRQSINDMRAQFDDLQRQLSTGLKTDSYAKLGTDRNIVLSLSHQLDQVSSFSNTISKTQLRIELMSDTLTRINQIASDTKTTVLTSGFELMNGKQTSAQITAGMQFDEIVNLLNLEAEDRYLFGGLDTQTRPVALPDHIMNGDGDRAGLKQFIAERGAADLGVDGRGRLVSGAVGSTMRLAEDAAGSPFGFKLESVTSNLGNATVSGPAGAPSEINVHFTGVPVEGQEIDFVLRMPDGTTTNVKLKATLENPAGEGQFTIGGDGATTAANLQAALDQAIVAEADVTLKAASAVEASNNFFDYAAGGAPQRVDGPPFATATALRDATEADTVFWYRGDLSGTPGGNMTARVDQGREVSYGARADQSAIRDTLKMSAMLAAVEYTDTNSETEQRSYEALTLRAGEVLNFRGTQSLESIVTGLGLAASTLARTQERHDVTVATGKEMLGDIQNADSYEVGVKLTTLISQLQASYQVTSMLSQMSLVNYL